MKRQFKSTLLVAAALASVVGNAVPVSACGGRSGGFARGFSRPTISRPAITRLMSSRPTRNFRQPVVQYQPSPSINTYSQPAYTQPSYAQPAQNQVIYQQPTYTQPAQPVTHSITTSQVVSQPSVSTQPRPQATSVSAAPPIASSPNQPSPNQPSTTTPTAQTAPVAKQTATQSALQALVSITKSTTETAEPNAAVIPEFTAAASASTANHIGTWRVNLPGNQSVELTLNTNSQFTWTATKDGKTSNFGGQYRLSNGRLTLVRSADLQQMAGSWTAQDNGFTFKLDGAKTGGLNFNRS